MEHYLDTLKLLRLEARRNPRDDYYAMKAPLLLIAGLVPPGTARDNAMGMYRSFRSILLSHREPQFLVYGCRVLPIRPREDPNERTGCSISRSANPVIASTPAWNVPSTKNDVRRVESVMVHTRRTLMPAGAAGLASRFFGRTGMLSLEPRGDRGQGEHG